jgi:hypothetical protein
MYYTSWYVFIKKYMEIKEIKDNGIYITIPYFFKYVLKNRSTYIPGVEWILVHGPFREKVKILGFWLP